MTAAQETLAAALERHPQDVSTEGGCDCCGTWAVRENSCDCGWYGREGAVFADHLAEVTAAWFRAQLADNQLREQVAEIIAVTFGGCHSRDEYEGDDWTPEADAALAAVAEWLDQ